MTGGLASSPDLEDEYENKVPLTKYLASYDWTDSSKLGFKIALMMDGRG